MTVSDPASDERDKFAARAREYIGEMSREVERDEEREAQVKAESLANIARNAKAWDVWLSWVAAPQSGRGPAPTKPSLAPPSRCATRLPPSSRLLPRRARSQSYRGS